MFHATGIVGSDGLATGFGDSGDGIVTGPDQRDFDISIIKKTPITEKTSLELRAEFFKAFNTPSFGFPGYPNPDFDVGTVAPNPNNPNVPSCNRNPTGGQITSTGVAPRVIQFALKLYF